MSHQNVPLPLAFRQELLQRLAPALRAGECCSLIGTSGAGKSNLARFVKRVDVRRRYWDQQPVLIVLVDSHSLVFGEQPPEYVVAELMMHRLIMELESLTLTAEISAWASNLYERVVAQPSPQLALRYLERLCARLCDEQQVQIVFVFDQFEDLWQTIGARFFLNLRNLRDQFKYQLVYLVMTRTRLQRLRTDLVAVEAFWELFSTHVFGLGMYSAEDASHMLERLAQRRSVALDAAVRDACLTLSGRHPSLLRAVFWQLCDDASRARNSDRLALLDAPPVAEECQKIWSDLLEDEQRIVREVAAGQVPQDPQGLLGELRLKEIVVGEPLALFSPLFSAFVQQHSVPGAAAGIVVDVRIRQVLLNGQPLKTPLSRLEFNLLAYLARHSGHVCRREDILRELYGGDWVDVNDQRLDTILRRLRETLDEDARHPRYLVTHRGVGIQLTHGQVLS